MTLAGWGTFSLVVAMIAAVLAGVCGVVATANRLAGPARAGRWMIVLAFAMFSVAAAVLIRAFLTDNFAVQYVAEYSERALPLGYKLAAFWAGQAGSILLWGWLIAACAALTAFNLRRAEPACQGGALIVLALAVAFFAALMVFTSEADPFATVPLAEADGHGLNPMLQDPAMVAHPPLLFIGYAGFTVPLALLVGGLSAGTLDAAWLARARRWALAAWTFLGVGIALGAWWAYVELGWGGYWAWDPVENASLWPWLTGAALLHVMVVQRYRRMFKPAVAALIVVTFAMCILGTWLTRSGAIQSVHAFGTSAVGTFFLIFLGVTVVGGFLVIGVRWRVLAADGPGGWSAREWLFAAAAALLALMAAFVLLGTLAPLLGRLHGAMTAKGASSSVDASFYNIYVLKVWGLPLLALMAFGPLVAYGRRLPVAVGRLVGFCVVAAGVVMAMTWLLGYHRGPTVVCVAIAATAVGIVAFDLVRSVGQQMAATGRGAAASVGPLLLGQRRRYGAQLAHLGMVTIMVGIVGSGLFGSDQLVRIPRDGSTQVGDYVLTFRELKKVRAANYSALAADIEVAGPDGRTRVLHPQQRRYDRWSNMVNSEIALTSTPGEDLYLALAGGDEHTIALTVLIKPLTMWLWIGCVMLALGGLLSLSAGAARAAEAESRPADRSEPKPDRTPSQARTAR